MMNGMNYLTRTKMQKIIDFSKRMTPGARLWSVLALACLAAVIVAGAWWHLGSAGICAAMASTLNEKED